MNAMAPPRRMFVTASEPFGYWMVSPDGPARMAVTIAAGIAWL